MAMAEPVIHLTHEAHAIVKAYCKRRDLRMSKWASEVLIDAVNPAVPVPKRRIEELQTTETDAFERAPFWAGQKRRTR